MLKNFLKKLAIISLELAVVAGGLYYLAQKKDIHTINQIGSALEQAIEKGQSQIPFPQPEQSVARSFVWKHKNVEYSLDMILYQSIYAYYQAKQKEYVYDGNLPVDWEAEYYAMFLQYDSADKTIPDLALQIKKLGKEHKLTDDQIIDLMISFVQSIAYDDVKAKNILDKTGNTTVSFPYEVLYEQKGVCSDKSILAYALLRQMGYGAAFFIFEKENHMAVAVQCPRTYSTYASGYCYAETTSVGNKIGVIPELDSKNNQATEIKQLSDYDANQADQFETQKLSRATVLLPIQGNQYSEIIQTEKIAQQIVQLKKDMEKTAMQIKTLKKDITEEEKTLKNLQKDLENYEDDGKIDKYNATVKKYNNLLEEYKKDMKKYNSVVTLYNADVKKYNALIKQ
jgi:hypothetical protein